MAILDAILSFNMMDLHPDLAHRPESLPIVFKIKPSNLFSGGGGTKIVFAHLASALLGSHQLLKHFSETTRPIYLQYHKKNSE